MENKEEKQIGDGRRGRLRVFLVLQRGRKNIRNAGRSS